MSINSIQSSIARKKKEVSELNKDRGTYTRAIADESKKAQTAKKSMIQTKSVSTEKTKQRAIERANNKIVKLQKQVSDIDKKISNKETDIYNEEKKLKREKERLHKKEDRDNQRFFKNLEKENNTMKNQLDAQAKNQKEMRHAIEDLSHVPDHINILFIASNPLDVSSLRLDEEAREVYEMIRKAEHRDSVTLHTRWAARPQDILQAINEIEPTIVHFSGHGSVKNELVFQDQQGNTKLINKEAIVQTMLSTTGTIRLVFFNSCFSNGQAELVVEHVDVAIGMRDSIGDTAAKVFAAQFYSAISFGHSVKRSFEQAKAALMLAGIREDDIPELYVKPTLNSEDIIIVNP